jgi:predicted esterase
MMRYWTTLLASAFLTLALSPLRAQTVDLLATPGEWRHDVDQSGMRILGISSQEQVLLAGRDGRLTPTMRNVFDAGFAAFKKGDSSRAYRLMTRLHTLLQGKPVTEATEAAAAVDFKLERKIVAPGERMGVRIEYLYTLGQPLTGKYTARVSVKTVGGGTLETLNGLDISRQEDVHASLATANLKPGRYAAVCDLLGPDGTALASATREFLVDPTVRRRVTALRRSLERLQQNQVSERGVASAVAMESIEYIVETFERALSSYVGTARSFFTPMVTRLLGASLPPGPSIDPFDIARDLTLAEDLSAALLAKKDPLPTRTGDLHLAFRSGVDGTLQPFRAFVPAGFDPSRKYPLVIALHGSAADENTYMDAYRSPHTGHNLLKELAQEHGYFLATPKGRDPWDFYNGNSEMDVLDVMDHMLRIYPIDAGSVFLTGHSMGGTGTWTIGFRQPQRFRALAPVASPFGGSPDVLARMFVNVPAMPVLFSAGLKDTLASPETCRRIAEMAKKELKDFRYVEYPDDHFGVGVSSMKAIFDFFDGRRRE